MGKSKKCAISGKEKNIERTDENLTRTILGATCVGCLSCLIFFNSVQGLSTHFAKFLMLRFSEATTPTVFIRFQPNVM